MWFRKRACVEMLLASGLALGLAMGPVSAVQAEVTVTHLANSGILVEGGEARVMIDGLVVEPYAVYGGLPLQAVPRLLAASGEFSGVDLVLVSHRHHEHNQPEFACQFMKAARSAEIYSSEQVIGLMREFCRPFITTSPRIHTIEATYDKPVTIEKDGATVRVFPLSHGTRKYARIHNYGHLVEINGVRVLHVGDAAMEEQDFIRAGLAEERVDVALIPFLFFQPGPGIELVRRYMNAPMKIATHIPPDEVAEVRAYMDVEFPQVQILEPLQQARFSAGARPSP